MQLQPKEYQYLVDGSTSIGFIAQEMEQIIPEVVNGEEGDKGIAYGLLTAVLTKGMQELNEENDSLKEKNSDLEKRLGDLETLIEEMMEWEKKLGGH